MRNRILAIAAAVALTTALAGVLAALWPGLPGQARAEDAPKLPLLMDKARFPVPALDFAAVNVAGKTVRLSDYKGQTVLLNFWATWCVPCMDEMPALDRLTQQLKGQKVKVLALDLQEPADKVQQFARNHKFGFDLLMDPAGEISNYYGVVRIPLTYIIDAKGNVLWRALGARQWDSPDAVKFIQERVLSGRADQSGSAQDAADSRTARVALSIQR